MKKIMILLALVASIGVADAQKSQDAIKKAIEKAQADCNNAKKAEKPATWINLAQKCIAAYTAPQGNGWIGGSKSELDLVMSEKPVSTTTETLAGVEYVVNQYPTCKYYFANGLLQMIVPTVSYFENPLQTARDAYAQAAKVDPKGSKTKDIIAGLESINSYFNTEGFNAYTLGEMQKASEFFAEAFQTMAVAPLSKIDSGAVYNAASTAMIAKNFDSAKGYLEKCIEIKYLKGGDVFAKLSETYKELGDAAASKEMLEKGFAACPQNQAILVGLINLYLSTKENPEKLFSLLDQAKVNEPDNASLYYVEGNIRKELGQKEEALAAYDKCLEVNPEYEYGEIGKGLVYTGEADAIQEIAQKEFNQKKYEALIEQYIEVIEKAAVCFEKSFTLTKDNDLKRNLADQLKNIYFRLRDKNAEYQAAYDRYNEISKNGLN